jgi:hypothetical protein
MKIMDEYNQLSAVLMGVIADSDPDETEIWLKADTLTDPKETTESLLKQGREILELKPFPWKELAEAMNRRLSSEEETRKMLQWILDVISSISNEEKDEFDQNYGHLWLEGAKNFRLVGPRGIYSDKRDIKIIDKRTGKEVIIEPDYTHFAAVIMMMAHWVLVEYSR